MPTTNSTNPQATCKTKLPNFSRKMITLLLSAAIPLASVLHLTSIAVYKRDEAASGDDHQGRKRKKKKVVERFECQ